MSAQAELLERESYNRNFLAQGNRRDGRTFEEYRLTVVNIKSLSNADGSAIVRLGKTIVVCGIKAELAKPKAETPKKGYLVVNIDLPPVCSPQFAPGPPSDQAQAATALLSQTILSSGCLDLESLCIYPDHLVWVLYVDVVCLNHDGGLLEASCAATTAALSRLTLPSVDYDSETGHKVVDTAIRTPLRLQATPFATTFAVFQNYVIHDPTYEEECLASGLVTAVAYPDSEKTPTLHVPGCEPLSPDQLVICMNAAKKRAHALKDMIEVSSASPER